MWGFMVGKVPSATTLICACLSVIIPWGVYKINQSLIKYSDPPWKKKE